MAIQAGETTFHQAKRGIVQNGLVLNLDAGVEESYNGGTTWTDLAGSNNGTLGNSPAFDSDNGGSIIFDGTDEYVGFSDDMIDANQDWTLSFFVNRSATQTSTIICGPNQSLQLRFEGGGYWQNHMKINNSTVAQVVLFTQFGPRGSVQRPLGVWFNVAITKSSYTYSLYVDGVFNQSVTDGSSVTFNNNPNDIGRRVFGSEYLAGKLANLSFYNRTLAAAEILQNFNVMKHRFGI
tara:strand:+ start:738 stop:1445 length:708 start_codon:yes stop_codon:yes gene_type:complete